MSVRIKNFGIVILSLVVMTMGLTGCFPQFDDDGIVDPTPNHQRWRLDEYANHDPSADWFFNWTYLTATNDMGEAIALCYLYVYDGVGTLTGISVLYSMMTDGGDTQFYTTRRATEDKITYMDQVNSNELDITVAPGGTVPDYSIRVLDNDTYQFTGAMTSANLAAGYEDAVLGYGDYEGVPFDAATTEIEWDLTYTRNAGWYGQPDIEDDNIESGTIMWNTYMHDADVSGTAIVDGTVYTFNTGYSDQNWGRRFPQGVPGENPEEYMWGWYHLTVPGTDISIIAGVGRDNIAGSINGITEGFFADIRYDGKHTGVRYVNALRSCPSCSGTSVLFKSSNSTLRDVNITRDDRSQWATLSDNLGDMDFPLNQTVYMATDAQRVTMAFHATLDNSLRFPVLQPGDIVFSDIESLNVNTYYKIEENTGSRWRPNWVTLYEGTVDCGGLEYGYMAPVILP